MPTYTLITVTHGGEVRHTRGFESLRMCQEARCIALTGMTIAQHEELTQQSRVWAARAERRRQEAYERQWRALHPPRPPSPEERASLRTLRLSWPIDPLAVQQERLSSFDGSYVWARETHSTLGDDGLVRDHFQVVSWVINAMQLEPGARPSDIRYAHCVIELPDEPAVPLSKLTPSEAA